MSAGSIGSGPVALAQLLETLKQPAIDQDPTASQVEQVLRPGDGAGGTQKRQRRHRMTILRGSGRIRQGRSAKLPSCTSGFARTVLLLGAAERRARSGGLAQQRLLTLDDIYDPTNG